ncbi:hypothetical protein GEU84_003515 [Fertoebacter nigrum]|uniref:Uncharacterized protein n=1 Tax=Fertoeibacter niger TaxID=2656921 RepID=A0A8X8KMX8_9RHOB|nr:hypothetical protein [Fertoeibacter niger]NUB43440.1 hypothetical protein [Fertoeibacter niger]
MAKTFRIIMDRIFIVMVAALIGLAALAGTAHADWRRGEFATMQACLAAIKAYNKSELQIFTDKPSQVSGRIVRTRESFLCTRKETGTKGTFFEGAFDDGE